MGLPPIGLLLLVSASPALAEEPAGLDALCGGADRSVLRLDSDEFHLGGYDTLTGLIQVRIPPRLERGRLVAKLTSAAPFLIRMAPETLTETLEARLAGQLRLLLRVRLRPNEEALTTRRCPSSALRVQPIAARLVSAQGVPLGARDLTQPLSPPKVAHCEVRVGAPRSAPGGPPANGEVLRLALEPVARGCLQTTLDTVSALQGAVTMELARSPVGRPLRPRVAIDGLVSPVVTHCLVRRIARATSLWKALPPGARVYVPIYFRGGHQLGPPPKPSLMIPVGWP